MKKSILCIALGLSLFSCKKNSEKNNSESQDLDTLQKSEVTSIEKTVDSGDFNINTIKESKAELGDFPYITLPETYTFGYDKKINPSDIKDIDKEYFAVNGKLIPIEGKTFKASIEKDRSDGKRFNKLVVEKSFGETILALGGVKVNNVKIQNSEIKRIGDKELIENHFGHSLNYNLLDDIKTYVIKTKDKQIWIQYYLMNEESGGITILEKEN